MNEDDVKKYAIIILLYSNGFSALWEVSSHMGLGLTNSYYERAVLNNKGYEAFNNPIFQLQTVVSRIQNKNLLGLDWSYVEGGVKTGKYEIDSNVTNKFEFMGLNILGGRKLIDGELFDLWRTADFGLGRFTMGLGPSDSNPWKYDSFLLSGNLGL